MSSGMKKYQLATSLAQLHEELHQQLKGKHIVIRCKVAKNTFTLFQRNIHQRIKPASTVKLFLLKTLFDLNIDVNRWLKVEDHHITKGSGNNLKAGHHYLVKDLIVNLMVASSNTAACVLQDYVEKLLGVNYVNYLNKTHLKNDLFNINLVDSHGLTNQNQYVSVSDFSKILDSYIGEKKILKWMNIEQHEFSSQEKHEVQITNTYKNLNHNHCIGVKTGTLVPGVFNIVVFFKFKRLQGYIIDFYNQDAESRTDDIQNTLALLKQYREAII